MTVKIAINGLGRIGRCVLRALIENKHDGIEVVLLNGPAPIETHIHLLKYDSVHGTFAGVSQVGDDQIDFGLGPVKLYRERDPKNIDWSGVDIVFECTGRYKNAESLQQFIDGGAKKVLISAPAEGAEATIVHGVNDEALDAETHKFVSVGSCTTNCLAPVAKVLHDNFGIDSGFMTTIHAYTNDQNITDATHKDLRRARAAAQSMIPTKTGAAKAIGLVIPELSGKLDGEAVRVPTPNVSVVDFTFNTSKDIDAKSINNSIKQAASGPMKGVLGYNDEPLVSIDFNHDSHSSIFDATGTKVIGNRFGRVLSWYDNEWGFSNRMLDIAKSFGGK